MNTRNTATRLGGLALCAAVAGGLIGCEGTGARWSTGYNNMRHERANQTAMEQVRVDFVSPDEMRWSPVPTGQQLIATSHFWRDTPIPNDPSEPNSQLRAQAAKVGANYVRWTAIREESPAFGERYRYRAVFYRGHRDPLPLAAALPSIQPDIRIVEHPMPDDTALAEQGESPTVDGFGPGEAVAEVQTESSLSDN